MTTAANDDAFRSLAGQHETAEPAATNPKDDSSMPPPASAASAASANRTSPHQSASRSLTVSGSPSTATSPESSRDSSPARMPNRQPGTSERPRPKSGLRSRKSSTDVSPSRGPGLAGSSGTVPSAAAIQRALSSANIPNLPPISVQDPSRVPRHQKPTSASGTASGESTPHWPISPRLKSPPPSDTRSRSRRNSLRKQSTNAQSTNADPAPTTPSIIVQSSSPASSSRIPIKDEGMNSEDDQATPTMKSSSRGASGAAPKLETVQEASLPTTPGFDGLDHQSMPPSNQQNKASDEEQSDLSSSKVTEDLSPKPTKHAENGSDGGSKRSDDKGKSQEQRSTSQRPNNLPSKSSFSSLSAVKSRTEAPSKNMTVETETVSSIPQSVLGNNQERSASGRGEASGSLRLKPSNETIRPKKDKQKRTQRKTPSINSNTVSSKADIFEAKVANTMDEADSSDSEETFVYESNPPDPQPHRSRQHHHSRTPSMTSITSLADPRAAVRDAHKIAAKKSSMKFANNPYTNPNSDPDANDRSEGTMRAGSGRVSGGSHHHHIGRHGQARGGLSYVSVPDSDSSFPQSSKTRVISARQGSQPNSPKFHTFRMGNGLSNGNKKHGEYSNYDVDTENAADDERTPLIGSIRTQRTRTSRRPGSASIRQLEHQRRRSGGWCRRFAGCLVLSILLLVLVFSAVGLIIATTKELLGVGIYEIRNVIATEQEIMLDLVVNAVNPNIISVTVSDMDVNVFAKSKHVGSDRWWREHPHGDRNNKEHWNHIADPSITPSIDGIDEGTDPIDDPDVSEPRTMLLGRIFHFDSPLSFDGSFFKHEPVESMGELRLAKPGNKTEAGGAERWEEVLQYPFELIVRGVFKYQLPLSTREHRVPITASYFYDPDEEKKKVKAVTPRLLVRNKEEKVDIFKPWGRFDARGRLTS